MARNIIALALAKNNTGKEEQTKTVSLDLSGGDQIVMPDAEKVLSEVTILKPATLLAENIKKDINIAGVTGTYEGSGGGITGDGEFLVQVIDYDGTLIKGEYLDTNETFTMPDAPSHEGLVFDGWSCSVNIVNGQITVTDNNVMAGAMYHTASGYVELDVVVPPKKQITLQNYTGVIDWGDGTEDSLLTHTYDVEGEYTISLKTSFTTLSSLVVSLCCTMVKNIKLSNNITSIAGSAFYYYRSLISITIPSSVTSIGSSAFYNCSSLTNIIIPSNVTSINSSAFYGCKALISSIIPNGVTSIGENAFRDCPSITSIAIPSSMTSIGANAFRDCLSIANFIIPNNVTSIGINAFYGCYSLTSIAIPSSMTSIGYGIFNNCISLASIAIPSSVTSIGINAFYGCYSLISITIPSNVTSIENNTFNNCLSITSITIPSSVTSISGAFNSCYLCGKFDFSNHTSVPSLTSITAFTDTTGKIVVPDALYNDWISASNWSNLTSQIMKVSEWEAL